MKVKNASVGVRDVEYQSQSFSPYNFINSSVTTTFMIDFILKFSRHCFVLERIDVLLSYSNIQHLPPDKNSSFMYLRLSFCINQPGRLCNQLFNFIVDIVFI